MLIRRCTFIVVAIVASWLAMTALHEFGHVLNAWISGGQITQIELPPRGLGHTQVSPNPSPAFVAWGGALWGMFLGSSPLFFVRRAELANWMARFFAGICLLGNGAYLGAGCFIGDSNGADDAHELLRHGTPLWLVAVVGLVAIAAGLVVWHALGPRAGFGRAASLAGGKVIACLAILIAVLLSIGWSL